jgi:hypothetical protein
MTPRLLVVCLGGLAGAGAVVCCDMDDGAEALDAPSDGEAAPDEIEQGQAADSAADPAAVH